MRYLILLTITVILALFIFLAVALQDDKRWFKDFSNNHGQNYFDYKLVDRISDLTLIEPPPPVISFTSVFAISKNDSVAITTFQNLRQIYLQEYQSQFQKFSQFLYEVLNQNIKLNTGKHLVRIYCQSVFKIDTAISILYQKEGILWLLNRYLSRSDSSYLKTTYNLPSIQQNSLSYYFFLNHLVKQVDDYQGKVYFRKLVLPK